MNAEPSPEALRKRKQRKREARKGWIPVQVVVHKDDKEQVCKLADRLNNARGGKQ